MTVQTLDGKGKFVRGKKAIVPMDSEKFKPGGRTSPRGKINIDPNLALVHGGLLIFLHKGFVLFSVRRVLLL